MKDRLNRQWIINLVNSGKSYKEVVEITGYKKNSVYGLCRKLFGKMEDRNMYRRQSIPITQEQKEFIFGTLLGDGSLQRLGKSIMGRTNHSIKQENYCKFKQYKLKDLTYKIGYSVHYLKDYDKEYNQCYFCFKPNTELLPLYKMFYKNGKKDIPEDLTLLTPKAMAWWFMDDGTASSRCSISIATCNFSLEGLLRLQKYLKDTYDISITIQKDFKIYFSAESAIKFYNLIKDYVLEDMMYKFRYINILSADLKLR